MGNPISSQVKKASSPTRMGTSTVKIADLNNDDVIFTYQGNC